MSYLLDTNVISELRRKQPDRGVVEWLEQRPAAALHLSVLTVGELRKGIETVEDPRRKAALVDWLEIELPAFFHGRILPIDHEVADRWGRIVADANRPLPAIDSLIAATASFHGLTLVTRNVRDFAGLPIDALNPWQL